MTDEKGLIAPIFAMPTPMRRDGGIDVAGAGEMGGYLSDYRVPTIIVNGTTGEFPSTTREEKREVLAAAREAFGGRVVAGIGGTSVAEVVALAEDAGPHCDAFLVLPPYYYAGVSEAGLHAFFAAVLGRVGKPTLLYNFPKHTGNTISAGLFGRLAGEFGHLAGIKDSSGSVESARAFKDAAPDRGVFLGADGKVRAGLKAGIDGPATGAGNAFPDFILALVEAWREGEGEDFLERIEQRIEDWREVRESVGADELAIIKAALVMQMPELTGFVRPPLVPLDKKQLKALEEGIERKSLR